VVRQIDAPVVLVGHSYGGAVITVAGVEDNVRALVHLSAYALEVGESLGEQGRFPDSDLAAVLAVSQRALALPSWLVTMLRECRIVLADRFGVPADELTGPVFPNSLDKLRDKYNTLARWREFRRRAGYPWVTFRTFRRSVAIILDEAGLSARQIADQLGHSKVSTTQDVYMGRRMSSRRAAEAPDAIRWFDS
jgi:integrase